MDFGLHFTLINPNLWGFHNPLPHSRSDALNMLTDFLRTFYYAIKMVIVRASGFLRGPFNICVFLASSWSLNRNHN